MTEPSRGGGCIHPFLPIYCRNGNRSDPPGMDFQDVVAAETSQKWKITDMVPIQSHFSILLRNILIGWVPSPARQHPTNRFRLDYTL